MANIDVTFDNKNYNIDLDSFSTAINALKSHLSTTMSGSGATISLGGTTYNIDSTKLTTARNVFVSHLGTVAGNGYKVVVNGVEYNVASDKMTTAVSELHAVLGGLNGGSGNGNNGELNQYGFYFDKGYSCFDAEGGKNTFIFYKNGTGEIMYNDVSVMSFTAEYDLNIITIHLDAESSNMVHVLNDGTELLMADETGDGIILSLESPQSSDGESHNGTIPAGAYYMNQNTGDLYNQMPDSVTNGDMYLYGDYCYLYRPEVNGWAVTLLTEDLGLHNYFQGLTCVDRNQTHYGAILTSINRTPVVSLGHIVDGNTIFKGTFNDCINITSVGSIGSGANVEIPDSVTLFVNTFNGCTNLNFINCPIGMSKNNYMFYGCVNLSSIIFNGTMEQWNAIDRVYDWNKDCPVITVTCTDGTVVVPVGID